MSEQESKSGGTLAAKSSVVVVEQQATTSRHNLYRPNDLQDEQSSDAHHKRSTVPAVPSFSEVLKSSEDSGGSDQAETKDKKPSSESEAAKPQNKEVSELDQMDNIEDVKSEKPLKQKMSKKLSSITKRGSPTTESIVMANIATDFKKSSSPSSLPAIPAVPLPTPALKVTEEHTDEDSITGELPEPRTEEAEPEAKHSGWSDDEEAGGLPASRSESRSSRVSRAVRYLFCCGMRYEAATEDYLEKPRADYGYGI